MDLEVSRLGVLSGIQAGDVLEYFIVRMRARISFGMLLVGVLLMAAQCPNGDSFIVVLTADPTSGVAPLSVSFDASSSVVPEGSIIGCDWDFGDGGTGSGATISHTYTHPGVYTAELAAMNTEGEVDSDSCTITVTAAAGVPPSASFTASPTSGQAPLAVSFNASGSSDSDGIITAYAWLFGDGGSSSGVIASHTYGDAGIYTAQLTVTDDDGGTDIVTRTIQVSAAPLANNPPTASFTASPTSGQATLAVSFDASGSSDSDGSIVSYTWTFGDGGSSSGVTASHTYGDAGTYTAQLTVTDDDGGTDIVTRTIQVSAAPLANNPPTASFTASPTSGQAPLAVSFDASGSSDSDGSIASYAWTFGDGGSSSGVTASHTYSSAGTYTAQLTVTDDDGATDTATAQIACSAVPVLWDLYVDAGNGSDTLGDGTRENPYLTITRAVAVAGSTTPHDQTTIHVAQGVYSAALGEVFPLFLTLITLVGESSSPHDVKIGGTLQLGNNTALDGVRCYRTLDVSGHHIVVENVVVEDLDTPGCAVSVKGGDVLIQNCSIREKSGGISATGTGIAIRDNEIRCSPTGRIGIFLSGDGVVSGNSVEYMRVGVTLNGSGVVEANIIHNCIDGIEINYTASPVTIAANTIAADPDRISQTKGIRVTDEAEAILEDNVIGPCIAEGVVVSHTAVADLGGGTLGSTGGNSFTAASLGLYDMRYSFTGTMYALGNTWKGPQPTGTAHGPASSFPDYQITQEGNSIIFSD